MEKLRLVLTITGILFLTSFISKDRRIGKKVPIFNAQTISGTDIDTSYFKKKVTLLTFMYIGCQPCMLEIGVLNKLNNKFSAQGFQVLCIAPHTAAQVKEFLEDTIGYGFIRNYFQAEKPNYEIIAECLTMKRRTEKEVLEQVIQPECENISKKFKVSGFPYSLLIDKKGIIRAVYEGYAAQEDSITINSIGKDIARLIIGN